MLQLLLLFFLLLNTAVAQALPPSPKSSGVTHPSVTVTESNQGVQACASITDGATVCNPAGGGTIWLDLVAAGTACTAGLTARNGVPIAAGSCYVCAPYETGGFCYNWVSQICLILDSGSTDVTPLVTCR